MSEFVNSKWPNTTIKSSSYLKGRIGWQGLKASEFTDQGPYLITGTDFRDGKIEWSTCYHVTEERFQEASYIHVRNGDLLITKDGTIGKLAYVTDCPEKTVLNSGIFLLRCSNSSYEHRFLYHLLNSHLFDKFLQVNLAGSTISHLYQNIFEKFDFPIPDIELQQRMTDILDAIDGQIEQTEALIAKMLRVKSGVMHDLFTRGVTPDGHLRPTREQAPGLYKESPLGWIPKEWEVKPLLQVATYQHGRPFPSTDYSDEGVLLLRPGNLHTSGIVKWDASHTTRIPDQWLQECPEYVLKAEDIVMNLTAQSLEDQFLGRVCIIQTSEPALLNQRIARFQSIQMYHYFLYWLLRSSQFRNQIDRTVQGTKVQHIYNSDLNRVVLAIPETRWEQERISATLQSITESLISTEADLDKLRQQKRGLMHDLLVGKVHVSSAKTKEAVTMAPAHSDMEPLT